MGDVTPLLATDKKKLLEGLDRFRAKLEAGEINSYFIVGVGDDDITVPMWGAYGQGITVLRGLGAIESLKHRFLASINWEGS